MLPEIGLFSLIIALSLALIQSILPLIGVATHNKSLMVLAKPAALLQALFILVSFLILMMGFANNDFSVQYVAHNSSTQLPLIYRLCAVWGSHEGSLLLWVMLLGGWTAVVCVANRSLPLEMLARVLAVMGMISVGFLVFLLAASNPFARILLNIPSEGLDLNPLLQDPGFVTHPPMLYLGYVGFSVAFAMAIAGLMSGRLDSQWLRWMRPWTLIAWCFLTLGIVLGSWWAYRELGWGGWWFWDPVENASFMPWLVGTALIHSLSVSEKRDIFKGWTVLLAIIAFALSLLGTFLVRSGVLISVHAFAVDPRRGQFLLLFLGIVVGASLLLYALRASSLESKGKFNLLSRESFLLSNNVLLVAAGGTVLIGTLYPMILQALTGQTISVGPPYFNSIFVPIMLLLMLLMGMGPLSNWQKTLGRVFLQRIRWTLSLAFVLSAIVLLVFLHKFPVLIWLGLSLALWVMLAVLQDTFSRMRARRAMGQSVWSVSFSQFGMLVAHFGLAITVIGVMLVSNYSIERTLKLAPGEQLELKGYQVQFMSIHNLTGPNFHGAQAEIKLANNAGQSKLLVTEKRIYNISGMSLSKVALDINLFRDIYIALGEPLEGDAWSFRVYYKPFVRWLWYGGLVMMFGGLLAVFGSLRKRTQFDS